MTNLFLKDAYLREVTTHISMVKDVKKRTAISVDNNIFYPGGGGQPADTGTVSINNNTHEVSRVLKMDGTVYLCLLEKIDVEIGEICECSIDWEKRYRFMQCHTAAHLVMGTIKRRVRNYIPEGIEILTDGSLVTVNFSADWEASRQIAEEIVKISNEKISESLLIDIEEYENITDAIQEKQDIYRGPEQLKGAIRVVTITGWDANPCGGTHVKQLSEIGRLELVDFAKDNVVFTITTS